MIREASLELVRDLRGLLSHAETALALLQTRWHELDDDQSRLLVSTAREQVAAVRATTGDLCHLHHHLTTPGVDHDTLLHSSLFTAAAARSGWPPVAVTMDCPTGLRVAVAPPILEDLLCCLLRSLRAEAVDRIAISARPDASRITIALTATPPTDVFPQRHPPLLAVLTDILPSHITLTDDTTDQHGYQLKVRLPSA